MRKWVWVVGAVVVVAVCAPAQATTTFVFSPNDLINLYDQGPPKGTPDPANPRSVRDRGYTAYGGGGGINAWNIAGYGSTLDLAINADYVNWRDNNGGYITYFNTWMRDNNSARGWNEYLVRVPGTVPTATTSDGWTVEVSPSIYGGYKVKWSTTDPAKYLRNGAPDLGLFSFTDELFFDADGDGVQDTGEGPPILGQKYTVWFGGDAGDNDTTVLPDDRTFQATLDVTAVPEPLTLLGVLGSISAIAGYIRRRRLA